MGKLISCGKFNNYYKYIFLSIVFKILNDSLYGFNYNETFVEIKIFYKGTQKKFSKHYLIHQIFNHLGIYFISLILLKYEKDSSSKDLNSIAEKEKISSSHIVLIHTDNQEEEVIVYDVFKPCLLISFLWIFEEQLLIIYGLTLKDLDFWMFELLIITYLIAKMFKFQIYKHHKFAILFNLLACLLKIAKIFLSYKDNNILYTKYEFLIPTGIAIYLILITIRAFVNTKIKWFMDLRYVSSSKLLEYYGIVGAIICFVTCCVITFFNCKYINDQKNFYDYICKVDNGAQIYFDSFKIYFKTFKNINAVEIIKEIVIVFSGMITFFLITYFSLLVIKYLTPVYIVFSNPIYYFVQKMILVINTKIREGRFFKDNADIKISKFFLDSSGDILSILGCLVYLEIIELNFNGYNFNLRKNIIQRSLIDSNDMEKRMTEISGIIEDDEETDDLVSN